MIFATVGTHYDGFPRMLEALERLDAEPLVVQHGHGPAPRNAALAKPFMSFGEVVEHVEDARAVVTHAGVGSILLAIRAGHLPVVVPRLHRLGEHVDDHQIELAQTLEEQGRVVAVWEVETLAEALAKVPRRARHPDATRLPLHAAVQAALAGAPRRRRLESR